MKPYIHIGRTALRPALMAGVLAISLAGCSASPSALPSRPARPIAKITPGPSLSPEEQSLVDGAWATYLKMNDIYVKAAQTGKYDFDPDPAKRPLYLYAGGRFIAALERDLGLMSEEGLVRTGEPKVVLRRVVSVSPTSIVVEACVDDSGTDTVLKKTGKSVAAPGQNQRYPVTLRAGLYPDNRWRWVESGADRASSC